MSDPPAANPDWQGHHWPELESDFRLPAIDVSEPSLLAHFRQRRGADAAPLRNYHREPEVSQETRREALPSAVLIPFVARPEGLSLLVTRRHREISMPGHICFPGGRVDSGDPDRTTTALRETGEEIGLPPDAIEVLGELGPYHSHSGHHIVPVVGLLRPPLALRPHPREVEEILEIPATTAFRSDAYRLRTRSDDRRYAVFTLELERAVVTGATVCLLMNLYAQLVETHPAGSRVG